MVLLAAFKVVLARYAGTQDIVVGVPIAGRVRPEVEQLIGFFVNTLVLRTDCSGDPTFAELLGRVRETALGAYAHQDLPFEQLVEELDPPRDLSRNPVVQVTFQLLNMPRERLDVGGLLAEHLAGAEETTRFDLSVRADGTRPATGRPSGLQRGPFRCRDGVGTGGCLRPGAGGGSG